MEPQAARAPQAPEFESEWPALAQRLRGFLLRRNVSPWMCDDIIQETATRLFAMWKRVDPAQSLWPLTVTIALNIVRDEARSKRSTEILGEVPERSSATSVENQSIARIELARVIRALEQMDERHRQVLLAEVGQTEAVAGSRGAVKVLRMRARKRLATLMERASAFGLAVFDGFKRVERAAEAAASRLGVVDGRAGAPVAFSVFAALSVVTLGPLAGPSGPPTPPSQEPRGVEMQAAKGSQGQTAARTRAPGPYVSVNRAERFEKSKLKARTGRSSRDDGPGSLRHGYRVPVGDGYLGGELEVDLLPRGSGGSGERGSPVPNGSGSGQGGSIPNCSVQVGAVAVQAACSDVNDPDRKAGVRARYRGKSKPRPAVAV